MFLKVLLGAMIGASVLTAAPLQCATNTLDQYIVPGFTCVGADMVQYAHFSFSFVGPPSASPLGPSTILVRPIGDGFTFSSTFFNSLAGDLALNISLFGFDPPIIDDGWIFFDPIQGTTGLGEASIVASGVNSNQTPFNFGLLYDSTHSVTTNSAVLGPAASVQISNLITLRANGGTAGFNSFEERLIPVQSPEPKAIALSIISLVAIVIFRRRLTT